MSLKGPLSIAVFVYMPIETFSPLVTGEIRFLAGDHLNPVALHTPSVWFAALLHGVGDVTSSKNEVDK